MGVKGSWQRPGQGYAEGWDAIFRTNESSQASKQKPLIGDVSNGMVAVDIFPDRTADTNGYGPRKPKRKKMTKPYGDEWLAKIDKEAKEIQEKIDSGEYYIPSDLTPRQQIGYVLTQLNRSKVETREVQAKATKLAEAASLIREQTIFEISEIFKSEMDAKLAERPLDSLPPFENGEVRGIHHCYSFMKKLLDAPGDD